MRETERHDVMFRLPAICVSFVITLAVSCGGRALLAKEVTFQAGDHMLKAYLNVPKGTGPFPVVIYLHGGLGPIVAGDPKAVSAAIAKLGYIGFAPVRGKNSTIPDNVKEMMAAIEYVKQLDNVDSKQMAIVGFSRGGLLAYMASTRRTDLKAFVLMAPAPGGGALRRFMSDARRVSAPALLLVAKNDTRQADHVTITQQLHNTLKAAKKESTLIVYPPFGRDGHQLFFQVRQKHWSDIEKFLKKHLAVDSNP